MFDGGGKLWGPSQGSDEFFGGTISTVSLTDSLLSTSGDLFESKINWGKHRPYPMTSFQELFTARAR